MQKQIDTPETLESRLAVLRDATAERLPQLTAGNQRLFAELTVSTVPGARAVGDPAPDIMLNTAAEDRPLRLSWLLDNGPVVVAFYRGHWCPYSSVQLHALQAIYPEIHAHGAELLFIGPETRANAFKMREKWDSTIPVMYDADGRAMDAFRLAYDIPDYLAGDFARLGFPRVNPGTEWRLPITATFVIDQLNVIRARHLDPDYTRRMEPSQIIEQLKRLPRVAAA